jgi:hypothetical protein
MSYITSIIKRLLPKEVPRPVGRWNIEYCNSKINHKVDLSNEDHCGPCGQYALIKMDVKPTQTQTQTQTPKTKTK